MLLTLWVFFYFIRLKLTPLNLLKVWNGKLLRKNEGFWKINWNYFQIPSKCTFVRKSIKNRERYFTFYFKEILYYYVQMIKKVTVYRIINIPSYFEVKTSNIHKTIITIIKWAHFVHSVLESSKVCSTCNVLYNWINICY